MGSESYKYLCTLGSEVLGSRSQGPRVESGLFQPGTPHLVCRTGDCQPHVSPCHVFLGSFSTFAMVTEVQSSLCRGSFLSLSLLIQPLVDGFAKDGKVSLIITRGESDWGLGAGHRQDNLRFDPLRTVKTWSLDLASGNRK